MAYSFLVSTSKGVGDGTLGPTDAIDTSGANFLVIGVHYTTFITFLCPTPTDSKSNTWLKPPTDYPDGQSSITDGASVALFYAVTPTVGSGHTFNVSGTDLGAVITVLAFSGAPAAGVIATTSRATVAPGTSIQPGTIVPGTSDQLFINGLCLGAFTRGNYGNVDVPTIDDGFTLKEQVTSHGDWFTAGSYMNGIIAYKIQTGSASPENPTWSWSSTGLGAVMMTTFSPADEPDPPPPLPPFGGTIGPIAWMEWPRRVP